MNELTAPVLKRKMDPLAMSNDSAMLRQLTAELNDPRLTGAVVPPEERVTPNTRAVTAAPPSAVPAPISSEVPVGMTAEAADRLRAQMVLQQSQSIAAIPGAPDAPKIQLSTAPVPASPQPAGPRHQPAQRIFFTGHPLVGKKWLAEKIGAHVVGFDDPIRNLAFNAFGEQPEEKLAPFIATIRAFGENDPKMSLSVVRAMFADKIRESGAEGDAIMGVPVSEFGTPGYWTKCLLARVARYLQQQPKSKIVVLDLSTVDQYKALQSAGFKPYHVACHVNTRAERGATQTMVNPLATQIEQSTTKELSQNPGGKKLWCIWNDPGKQCPSGRLMTIQEFLDAYK